MEAVLVSVHESKGSRGIWKLIDGYLLANVLFVARCGLRQYHRIGKGMIFDIGMVEEFGKVETVEIQLV